MLGNIFISYRREDEPAFAGRLFDRLEGHFGSQTLFMDIDSIPPGKDFVEVIERRLNESLVFLAVIGNGWLSAKGEAGNRRLDDEDNFVRLEIEAALQRGIRIIPVLVNDTTMPRADELPEGIELLARRNAVRLTHERFRADTDGLIETLNIALAEESMRRIRSIR